MNIANNILKHNLKNVYFLIGTACGGKTTMGKIISEKYGFTHFNDNWHEPNFLIWQSLINEKYQKHSAVREKITDYEAHFNRSYKIREETVYKEGMEYLEFAIIELIKLSQKNKVIADICIPIELICELSDYNRIACLITSPERVVEDYYQREDHKEYIECIMSLKNPQKTLEHDKNCARFSTQKTINDVTESGLYYIMRDENSTIEKTLSLLESHFKLV